MLTAAAISQAAIKPGTYTGQSSEHQLVTVKIQGHTIKSLKTTIGYNGKCGQGGGPGYNIDAKNVKIGKHGSFSAHIKLRGIVPAIKAVNGTLKGKAANGKVHGTITDLVTAKFACNGYVETFTVTHTG